MTIPTTSVTMSSINRALNRSNNAQINFSTQVRSINTANTMGSTRGRVKEYYCLLKGDGSNGSTSILDYTNTFVCYDAAGATISTTTSKFGGASIRTNGVTTGINLLNSPVNMNLASYSGDWTIEGFCYWQGGSNIARFLSGFAGTFDSSIRIQNGDLHAYYFEPPNNDFRSITISSNPQNQWFHFALVKQSTTLYLYRDGVSGGGVGVNSSAMKMDFFTIGQAGGESFDGYLDEIRFSNFARYTGGSTFTPPTTSFAS